MDQQLPLRLGGLTNLPIALAQLANHRAALQLEAHERVRAAVPAKAKVRSEPVLPVGKNTPHDYLAHLEDAFLVRTVFLHAASERQRMVNPRKAYPIDPGLISLDERTGRANLGHALETVVLLELDRRGCEIDYVRTGDGYAVDFFARDPEGNATLIQVCTDVGDSATYDREAAPSRPRRLKILTRSRCCSRSTRSLPARLCPRHYAGSRPLPGCWATNLRGQGQRDEG